MTEVTGGALATVQDQPLVQSPLDMSPAQFRQGLQRRTENRAAMMEWVRGSLVEGVDFGSVKTKRGLSKPSLFKPGAEKICGMLNVIATFPTLPDYEQAALRGEAISDIILRCELLMGGQVAATGAGARNVDNDDGDLNKALKMAMKSAMIDATLRLGGLSEVFTQDIEDMRQVAVEGEGEPHMTPRFNADTGRVRMEPVEPAQPLVPMGKHKGQPWADVPDDYLDWCVAEAQKADLRDGAQREIERRERLLEAQEQQQAQAAQAGDEGYDDPSFSH